MGPTTKAEVKEVKSLLMEKEQGHPEPRVRIWFVNARLCLGPGSLLSQLHTLSCSVRDVPVP